MREADILVQAERLATSWRDYQSKKTFLRGKGDRVACALFLFLLALGVPTFFYPRVFNAVINSKPFNGVALLLLIGVAVYGVYYRIFNPKLSIEDRKFLAIAKGDWQSLETLNSVRKRRSFKEAYPLWIRVYLYGMGVFAVVIALWCAFVYLAGW